MKAIRKYLLSAFMCLTIVFTSMMSGLPFDVLSVNALNDVLILNGSGLANDPYLINSVEEFVSISERENVFYKLMSNLDLDQYIESNNGVWIGVTLDGGGFDGNNKMISGLWSKVYVNEDNGLFGSINASKVQNLTVLIDYDKGGLQGYRYIGGLAGGVFANSVIDNVVVDGNLTSTRNDTRSGGIVGRIQNSQIKNSIFSGIITANNQVGGIVSEVTDSTISNSFASGELKGKTVGGIIGHAFGPDNTSKIENCYSSVYIEASVAGGGLVGSSKYISILSSYAIGTLEGNNVGGIIGSFEVTPNLSNVYFDTDITNQVYPAPNLSLDGATGLDTKEMVNSDTLSNPDKMGGLGTQAWIKRPKDEYFTTYPELKVFNSEFSLEIHKDLSMQSVIVARESNLILSFMGSDLQAGQSLSNSEISGTATDSLKCTEVLGSATWDRPDLIVSGGIAPYAATFNPIDDFYIDSIPINVPVIVFKGLGVDVNGLELVERDSTSIEVISEILDNPWSQTVEYAYTEDGSLPTTGWQDNAVFSHLKEYTKYTIYARAKENDLATAGPISMGFEVMTRDISAPTAKVSYAKGKLNQFTNADYFTRFFKNQKEVQIIAYDDACETGNSGIKMIGTMLSPTLIDQPEVTIKEWDYTYDSSASLSMSANTSQYLYVLVVDNEDNKTIYLEGIVVYRDVEVDVDSMEIERGTDNVRYTINFSGNKVQKVTLDGLHLTRGTHYFDDQYGLLIPKDFVSSLNFGKHQIKVSYEPMGYPYIENEDNEAPMESNLLLNVKKPKQIFVVSNVKDEYMFGDGPIDLSLSGIAEDAPITYSLSDNEARAEIIGNKLYLHNAGEFVLNITIGETENYGVTKIMMPIIVNKKPITITIQNQTKRYGSEDPKLTYVLEGAIEGYNPQIRLQYVGSDIGIYPITLDPTYTDPNYDIKVVSGIMKIIPSAMFETVISGLTATPETLTTLSQAQEVADLSNSIDMLSEYEQKNIDTKLMDKLLSAQKQAGQLNQAHREIGIDTLPWFVKLVVDRVEKDEPRYTAFSNKLTDETLIVLYDIFLQNTLTGQTYILPDDAHVTLTIRGLDVQSNQTIHVKHEMKDGSIQALSTKLQGTDVSCETSSFSLFGVTSSIKRNEQTAEEAKPEQPKPEVPKPEVKEQDGQKPEVQKPEGTPSDQSTKPLPTTGVSGWSYAWLLPCGVAVFIGLILRKYTSSKN